ncbi:MAG: hypothetical protein ABSD28_20120 [Tepidisphaeraceae bacterium]
MTFSASPSASSRIATAVPAIVCGTVVQIMTVCSHVAESAPFRAAAIASYAD